MITVVFVKNPFEPQKNREVRTLPYVKGKDVSYYVQQCTKDLTLPDMVISRNSYTINGTQAVQDKDFIVFSPVVGKGHGKNPLLIIATVALSVTAMRVGGLVAAGSFSGAALASATGFAAIGGYLAAAAVMFIGGSLIQRAFGTANTSGFKDTSENPTYSWTGITTTNGQNNPIPITYGTVRSGGQTIGKYINSDSDKQYLNWLVCAGYGPLKIYDVQLNDNPIENYKDVKLDTREGLNVQDIIPNFNDTISTKTLSYEILDNEWRTDLVTGSATQGLIIYVECSNGLYYANDKGGLDETYVTIEAQYAKEGTGDWKELATNAKITGSKSSAIRKQYRVDNLEAGQYYVRVKVVSRGYPTTSTRACTRIWWTGVSGIVYDDFSYPGMALIGIRAMATDQLSGSPTLKFMKQRSTVYVWNPNTNAYEEKAATNPAWAAYDMVHRANKITDARNGSTVFVHHGADASLMMYNQFSEWAAYCDQFNLKINIEINTSGEMLDVVNRYIAPVGRGIVELFGTKYGCVWDGPKEAVQMFGMGNIISGTFSETFLQTSDRANAVELTFTNAQKDYERDTVKVFGPTFDTDEYDTTSQLTYDGITDYEQAYREAKFQLYCNAYMVRTVSFQASIDAIACTVGDVIYVAHDVPMWQTSGRIASVNGTTVVVNEVMKSYDSTKTYTFAYRSSADDTRYEVGCKSIAVGDSTTTVVLASTPATAPAAGDIFDIAEVSKGTKKFVVRSISRTEDLVREIEALEYNENCFLENYTIPTPNNSESDVSTVQNVTNLVGRQSLWKDSAGQVHSKMYLSWQYPADRVYQYFSVFVSTDNKNFVSLGTAISKYFEVEVNVDTTYYVKVFTVNQFQKSSGTMITVAPGAVQSATTPTEIVVNPVYRKLLDGTDCYDLRVTWGPSGLSGRVYYKPNHAPIENLTIKDGVSADELGYYSSWIYAGEGVNKLMIPQCVSGDTYRIAICTANALGEYVLPDNAPHVDQLCAPRTTIPNTPSNLSIVFNKSRCTVSWSAVTNADIAYYEVRTDLHAGTKDDALLLRTNSLQADVKLTERTGNVYVYACGTDGKYSAAASVIYSKAAPKAPSPPTVTDKLGGMSIVAVALPDDCVGMNIYINDLCVYSVNNVVTYTCAAGIYDVSVAYVDYFGEGERSATTRCTVKELVDTSLLADQAVTRQKVDAIIDKAVQDTQTTLPSLIQSTQEDVNKARSEATTAINGVIDELNKSPGDSSYKSISSLKTTTDSISATVASNKTAQDGTNSTMLSKIETNASGISTVVANLNKAPGQTGYTAFTTLQQTADSLTVTVNSNKSAQDTTNQNLLTKIEANTSGINTVVANLNNTDASKTGYKAISALKQQSDSISSTVSSNKAAQDKINAAQNETNASLTSQITQTSSAVTSVVTNLNDATKAKTYSAIAQMADSIATKISQGDMTSYLQQDHTGFYIKGSLINIDGTTKIGDNVITKDMIQSKAVTAEKMDVESLSAITATIGTFQSATSGRRVVIKDSVTEVYNDKNVLVMRWGVW